MMSCSYPPHFMMETRNTALKAAPEMAKIKLRHYREKHGGNYVGGMEYTQLMKMIEEALIE